MLIHQHIYMLTDIQIDIQIYILIRIQIFKLIHIQIYMLIHIYISMLIRERWIWSEAMRDG